MLSIEFGDHARLSFIEATNFLHCRYQAEQSALFIPQYQVQNLNHIIDQLRPYFKKVNPRAARIDEQGNAFVPVSLA